MFKRKTLQKITYWAVLAITSLYSAAALESHIQGKDSLANLCVAMVTILLGLFIKETVQREIQKAIEEVNTGSAGSL